MKEKENMKLFTVGPAQMYPHTLKVRSQMVPYFRTPEFSAMNLESASLIKKIMDAEEDSEVIFLTASGSGAMEAAVMNCFDRKDRLLIVSGGTFGERFEKICGIHQIPYTAVRLKNDEKLAEEHLEKYDGQGYTGFLVNLHETYTGQLYDIELIHNFCEKNNLFLMADAISTFLCDEFHMKKYAVDVSIVSSQKGLCLAPGLSVVVLSRRIVEEKVKRNPVESLYFDFKDYILNMKRGQTPYTPCAGVLSELNDMLRHIDQMGVEKRIEEVEKRCTYFRNKIASLPVELPRFPLSNAMSPVFFRKEIAQDFFTYLKDHRNMMVNPVGGELGKRSVRVAHIGDLAFSDYDRLVEEMEIFCNDR